MRMAFDTILSDYVDAEAASKGGGFEPYRYECACCWEEVHICAANSRSQATHFRHRSGNNNVECENYLGNRSAIINSALSRRKTRDRIEFYFSSSTKLFSIGVKYNADELSEYEKNGTCFQVRSMLSGEPIISIPISGTRFMPDVSETFPISKFSWEYYIKSSSEVKPRKYEVFRKDARGYLYPSFFKIQAEDDLGNYQAKLIRTETLYTNTQYLIVFSYSYYALSFQNSAVVGKAIKFRTMDREFAAIPITFTQKTAQVENKLAAWKYKLEANETVTLLWPPSSQVDDAFAIPAKSAIIYSSFELQAHGNTNARSSEICVLDNGLSKIMMSGLKKVYKKNAELILGIKEEAYVEYQKIDFTEAVSKNYVAHDGGAYLFNSIGVSRLNKGTILPVTRWSIVKHYTFGYLDCIVSAPNMLKKLVGRALIEDICKNYKRSEKFVWSDFESLDLSSDAFTYIESCEKTGMINSAVKRFIEEGRI